MEAVLGIVKTVSAFPPDERLGIVGESVLGVLRELRLPAQKEPTRGKSYDALCGDVQAWLRREIEALRFEKAHKERRPVRARVAGGGGACAGRGGIKPEREKRADVLRKVPRLMAFGLCLDLARGEIFGGHQRRV